MHLHIFFLSGLNINPDVRFHVVNLDLCWYGVIFAKTRVESYLRRLSGRLVKAVCSCRNWSVRVETGLFV